MPLPLEGASSAKRLHSSKKGLALNGRAILSRPLSCASSSQLRTKDSFHKREEI